MRNNITEVTLVEPISKDIKTAHQEYNEANTAFFDASDFVTRIHNLEKTVKEKERALHQHIDNFFSNIISSHTKHEMAGAYQAYCIILKNSRDWIFNLLMKNSSLKIQIHCNKENLYIKLYNFDPGIDYTKFDGNCWSSMFENIIDHFQTKPRKNIDNVLAVLKATYFLEKQGGSIAFAQNSNGTCNLQIRSSLDKSKIDINKSTIMNILLELLYNKKIIGDDFFKFLTSQNTNTYTTPEEEKTRAIQFLRNLKEKTGCTTIIIHQNITMLIRKIETKINVYDRKSSEAKVNFFSHSAVTARRKPAPFVRRRWTFNPL